MYSKSTSVHVCVFYTRALVSQHSLQFVLARARNEISINLDRSAPLDTFVANCTKVVEFILKIPFFGRVGVTHDRACKYSRRLSSRCSDFLVEHALGIEARAFSAFHARFVSVRLDWSRSKLSLPLFVTVLESCVYISYIISKNSLLFPKLVHFL